MSYYDDLLNTIDALIANRNILEAKSLVLNELKMPYIPSDIETKLNAYLKDFPKEDMSHHISIEEIVSYLKEDEEKQLIAVNELSRLNLRDYLDIVSEYLNSDGIINAKVLLIDSLISQDISNELNMVNKGVEYKFIPKYIVPVEISKGYVKAIKLVSDEYMKEPSKLKLAKDLIYKECILALPLSFEEDEAQNLANKAIEYINKCFA